jgi:phosphoketolase
MTTTLQPPLGRAAVRREASTGSPLPSDLLRRMDAYWHAANYLSVGQIYLRQVLRQGTA